MEDNPPVPEQDGPTPPILAPALHKEKQRNIQAMLMQMVLASMINASVWTAYGVTIGDGRMWIPSGMGVTICMVQLAYYYVRKLRVQGQQRELPEQEELLGEGRGEE